jgi:hypothetical protein
MSDTKLDIHSKIDQLPPERRAEVEDFIDFLRQRTKRRSEGSPLPAEGDPILGMIGMADVEPFGEEIDEQLYGEGQ